MAERVLFIDRDGTLIREPADEQVDRLDKVELVNGVIPALLALKEHGFRFVIVSNQDGLGTDAFPMRDFEVCQQHMLKLFSSQGVEFDHVFICPHTSGDGCECRKPRTGLLTRYLAATTLDLERSAVIGDRETDLALAEALGVRGMKLDENGPHAATWPGIVETLCSHGRRASVERQTKETRIRVTVDLDAAGEATVSTGLGFFDHMLEQIAKHGGFRLEVDVAGDLHVDEHHTVEDTAICLGSALREALGTKRGIGRYGFVLPMDESRASATVDLSGRGAFVFEGEFPRDAVGGLSIEMVRHFFRSLADALGAAIHVGVQGENTHHMVEACFKSVGRALRPALRIDGDELPSTKGLLA